jgi:hypothetical protein
MFTSTLTYTQYISGLTAMAHNRQFRYMQRAAVSLLYDAGLTQCFWSDEACDCHDVATVHDIESGQDFCPRHFVTVQRARR